MHGNLRSVTLDGQNSCYPFSTSGRSRLFPAHVTILS